MATVLIVEDEPVVLTLAESVLRHAGYTRYRPQRLPKPKQFCARVRPSTSLPLTSGSARSWMAA